MGKSEFFYSWMITVYSVGEVLLAPVAGYSAKWIPYWYLLLGGIIAHTLGYLLYAVATNGWTMLLARFLAGAYSGVIETVGYAYISEKEADYLTSYSKKKSLYLSKKRIKAPKVKEKSYAFLTVTITVSYLAGPGKFTMYFSIQILGKCTYMIVHNSFCTYSVPCIKKRHDHLYGGVQV